MNRRDFLSQAGAIGVTTMGAAATSAQTRPPAAGTPAAPGDVRGYWLSVVTRLSDPVLTNLAAGRLKARMPVEAAAGQQEARGKFSHLEAFGRLLTGIAPWLELASDETAEGEQRARYRALALQALKAAVDPASPDHLNFTDGRQALVDAAFLAQAILRAPKALWQDVDRTTKAQTIAALESTRPLEAGFNNWLLFAGTIEAALKMMGATWDRMRVDYAIRQHEQWYKGDGLYGDGPDFHWDYYNSFVIQPMLLDVLDACADANSSWARFKAPMRQRAQRYAAILERLVAPDGSYPVIGRSLAYRFGAFQGLAQMALQRTLPEGVTPPQARNALTKIIRRCSEAPGTFDAQGWLTIGVCGHQPGVGESYISTGSLYLCSVGLLPLGLPASDPFWSAASEPTTSERAWSGEPFPIDHALTQTA